MMARITEEYLMIAETDHVLMRPLPNLATREQPAAYNFGYMHANAGQQPVRGARRRRAEAARRRRRGGAARRGAVARAEGSAR